jgi:hypothetical protein
MSRKNGRAAAVEHETLDGVAVVEMPPGKSHCAVGGESDSDLEATDQAAGDFVEDPPEADAEYLSTVEAAATAEPPSEPWPDNSIDLKPHIPSIVAAAESDDAHYINLIRQAEYSVQSAESDYLRAKEDAAEAKKYFDGKVADLRKIIREGSVSLPLFDQKKEQSPATSATVETCDPKLFTGEEEAAPVPDESWRQVTLLDAGVPAPICEKLEGHSTPIVTIGDYSDFLAKSWNKITDVAGIGQGKADKIADALVEYWKANPQHVQPEPGALPAEVEEPTTVDESAGDSTTEDDADPDPADEGFKACLEEGLSISDNPYPKGSISWGQWREGFQNAESTAKE